MTTPSNQAVISQFLAGKGLNQAAIAGVEGNLEIESGFQSTAYNSNEGAIGIAQWEGGRRTALDSYAAAAGTSETDLTTQLNYLWAELSGPYSGVLSSLESTPNTAAGATQAATTFQGGYEGSTTASLPARISAATSIYAGGEGGGGTGTIDTSGLGALLQHPGAASGALGSAAADAAESTITGPIEDVLKWLAKPFENAAFVIGGVIVVLVGLVLLAKAGENSDKSNSNPTIVQGGPRSSSSEDAGAEDALAAG